MLVQGVGSYSGPFTFIQYNFVSEDDNIKFSIVLKAGQDIPARLASCLDIEGTDADSSNRFGFGCHRRQSHLSMGHVRGANMADLHRSLLLGLAAPLATVLPLGCLCCVRLRDRRGAGGLANGPELHESRCCLAALGAPAVGSFKVLTGTRQNRQPRFGFIRARMQIFRTLMLWLRVGRY